MLTAAQIKLIRSLKDKKRREESGLFVVEGEKMVREACSSSFRVREVFREEEIGTAAMERISLCSSPSPVLALVELPERGVLPSAGGLCLALDSVRDPGNLGTIVRIADWFGVKRVYCSPDCADLYAPKVVQATMGSIFRVEVYYTGIAALCRSFRNAGLHVFGTLLEGEDIYDSDLPQEGLVVMGNESRGISPEVRAELDRGLYIPSFGSGGAESLNVAAAAAVTLSEFRRRPGRGERYLRR